MKRLFLTVIFPLIIVIAQANGEILKCKGSIVNSKNGFTKVITVYVDIVVPDDNAEEYVLVLADKKSGKFKSLLQYNPIVRKTFIEIATSLEKGGKVKAGKYEYIVTKMPDEDNSLVGFVYGYEPWVLKVDTWMKDKPFIFFQPGLDDLVQGKCNCE